ncbi:MAG: class I adenylate-forming enzyme family protein [Rhizobiaceae bacterium]
MHDLTFEDAIDHITRTDPRFLLSRQTIRGVSYPVFANAPRSIPALLADCRQYHGDGTDLYLVYQDERWTYDEFCRDVNKLAHALSKNLQVQPGDRVAIAMRNYPEVLIAMMAISSIGGVIVFLNGWWTTEELDYALSDSGAQLVFADGERAKRLRPLIDSHALRLVGVREAEECAAHAYGELMQLDEKVTVPTYDPHPDDDFAIMYSSGTTGHPKGVVQTHRGAISAVYSWWMTGLLIPLTMSAEEFAAKELRPKAALVVTPLFHVTATHSMFLLSLPMGGKLVLMYKWDAEEAVRLVEQEGITRFMGVPTQSAELMEAARRLGAKLPTLEFLGSGGAKRPPVQVGQLHKTFPHAAIATGWGMTETNAIGIGTFGEDYIARPNSAGRLYPPLQEMCILDDERRRLPVGETGEIVVKSVANMRCYLNQPEPTAEILQDGWLHTGDLGYVDDEGFVTIVDRKKSIIIRGGENISCLDVEAALHRHPHVLEAGVFPVPDERLGEVVGAGIQLRPNLDLTQEDLVAFLTKHIARFKIPQYIWFQKHPLPRGATDKIDRRVLSQLCLERHE